ncbi:helix-turn-helix domain-containing protein [Caulobacter segnis]|uniref:Transcriptional regulator n=1 Tax=Caulobacter segnis TaxID=88688 RepID=A0A2W5V9M7_9CAUL|nr:helix-turn-helix domain-containing protein [Caulobacter segnis]PZR36689.1 MAG: transcriptional regulator [Caulobacter segnis]
MTPPLDTTLCPIDRSAELIGDRCAILVLRELALCPARFGELQAQTGVNAQLLSDRLKRLQTGGLIDRRADTHHRSGSYGLTPKGAAFIPVLLALRAWGEAWVKDPSEGLAVETRHTDCGGEVDLEGRCGRCQADVDWRARTSLPTAAYAQERAARATLPAGRPRPTPTR